MYTGTIYTQSKALLSANVAENAQYGSPSVAVTRIAACCVGCESRAAGGRREDLNQGTERLGKRFRDRNRRGAAAARERSGRGAEARQAHSASAMRRQRRIDWSDGATRDGGGKAGGGERSEPPGQAERAESEASGGARDTLPKVQVR